MAGNSGLETILQRLEKYGLWMNKMKSEYLKQSVQYCGHVTDKLGLYVTPRITEGILKGPESKNVPEFKSFFFLH